MTDDDIQNEVESEVRKVDDRREMKSKQVHATPYGEMRFYLGVDLPSNMPEDYFKKVMAEYGHILTEAFRDK